jgi:hypothetical protein
MSDKHDPSKPAVKLEIDSRVLSQDVIDAIHARLVKRLAEVSAAPSEELFSKSGFSKNGFSRSSFSKSHQIVE